MASSSSCIIAMLFLFATMTAIVHCVEDIEITYAPESSIDDEWGSMPPTYEDHSTMPPEPSPAMQSYYDGCMKKMGGPCAEAIIDKIFEKPDSVISNYCCGNLVRMGRKCHIDLVRLIVHLPEFEGHQSPIMMRAARAWDDCSAAVSPSSAAPSSSSS